MVLNICRSFIEFEDRALLYIILYVTPTGRMNMTLVNRSFIGPYHPMEGTSIIEIELLDR